MGGTLLKNADKLGMIGGLAFGSMHGIEDLISTFENALSGQIHMPDIRQTVNVILAEPFFKNGLKLWGLGWVLKEIGIGKKWGTGLQKFGWNYALYSALLKLAWMSTHSEEGSNPSGDPTIADMYNRNVRNANRTPATITPSMFVRV